MGFLCYILDTFFTVILRLSSACSPNWFLQTCAVANSFLERYFNATQISTQWSFYEVLRTETAQVATRAVVEGFELILIPWGFFTVRRKFQSTSALAFLVHRKAVVPLPETVSAYLGSAPQRHSH